MKKSVGNRIWLFVFLLLCLIPSLGMLVFGPSEAAANEVLSPSPALREKSGKLNAEYLSQLADWAGDRFALRQEMVTAWSGLNAALFRTSAEAKVVVGSGRWLYYAETLDDYRGAGLTDGQLEALARNLALMQEYTESKGARFLFTIAPNKNSLYPEAMPAAVPRREQTRNAERLAPLLERCGVRSADLFSAFSGEDRVLYFETDSHWNTEGAALAADTILRGLGRDSAFYASGFSDGERHTGDLYEMLYPAGKELDENQTFRRPFRFRYIDVTDVVPFVSPEEGLTEYGTEEAPPVDKQLLETVCGEGSGTLLMFRDSFGNSLHPFFGDSFERAAFSRQMPYRLDWLEGGSADALIVEIVERNIEDLAEMAPVMPAPAADPGFSPAEDAERLILLKTEESAEMPGYIKVSGLYDSEGIREDTPVYINTQTDLFEACPAGTDWTESGYGCFTAYLPGEAVESGILSVVIHGNRDWLLCSNLQLN